MDSLRLAHFFFFSSLFFFFFFFFPSSTRAQPDFLFCSKNKRIENHIGNSEWVMHFPGCMATNNGPDHPYDDLAFPTTW